MKKYRKSIKDICRRRTAIEPTINPDPTDPTDSWLCPCCETKWDLFDQDFNYCPMCGQHIKWEDGNVNVLLWAECLSQRFSDIVEVDDSNLQEETLDQMAYEFAEKFDKLSDEIDFGWEIL